MSPRPERRRPPASAQEHVSRRIELQIIYLLASDDVNLMCPLRNIYLAGMNTLLKHRMILNAQHQVHYRCPLNLTSGWVL